MLKVVKKLFFYLAVFFLTGFSIWIIHLFSGGRDAAILMYHSVGESTGKKMQLDISVDSFEKQMKYLYENHYKVIPLFELLDILKSKKPIPPKAVVLTFDDGYENNYTKAFPVLKKYKFPATIFVISDFIGEKKEMYDHSYNFLTGAMLKEMSDSGLITIGAHSKSHIFLPKVADKAALVRQIFEPKDVLSKITGRPVEAFCYPIGGYDKRVKDLVIEAGYKCALTTFPKKGFGHDDIYALKRIKMDGQAFNKFIFFIETSGYYIKMKDLGKQK